MILVIRSKQHDSIALVVELSVGDFESEPGLVGEMDARPAIHGYPLEGLRVLQRDKAVELASVTLVREGRATPG